VVSFECGVKDDEVLIVCESVRFIRNAKGKQAGWSGVFLSSAESDCRKIVFPDVVGEVVDKLFFLQNEI
jgi:uncharacterized Fe-S cluster-containing protein